MRKLFLTSLMLAGCVSPGIAPKIEFPSSHMHELIQQCESNNVEAIHIYVPSTGLINDLSVMATATKTDINFARTFELRTNYKEISLAHCHPNWDFDEFTENLDGILEGILDSNRLPSELEREKHTELYEWFRKEGHLPSGKDYASHIDTVCLHSNPEERTTEYVVTKRNETIKAVRYSLRAQDEIYFKNKRNFRYCERLKSRVTRRINDVYRTEEWDSPEALLEKIRDKLPMFEIEEITVKN